MSRRIPLLLLATLLAACGVESEGGSLDTTSAQQQELSSCGDGMCHGWENSSICPTDCYCGDGVCYYDEAPWTCALDCGTR